LQPLDVTNDLQSLDSCVVDVDLGLFASLYNLFFFFFEDFDLSSDLSNMLCLVVPTNFDEVLIEPKNKIVDVDNDTFCVHDIIIFYVNDTCPKCQF